MMCAAAVMDSFAGHPPEARKRANTSSGAASAGSDVPASARTGSFGTPVSAGLKVAAASEIDSISRGPTLSEMGVIESERSRAPFCSGTMAPCSTASKVRRTCWSARPDSEAPDGSCHPSSVACCICSPRSSKVIVRPTGASPSASVPGVATSSMTAGGFSNEGDNVAACPGSG
eukprot:4264381-Prymnesium_polylepis.1